MLPIILRPAIGVHSFLIYGGKCIGELSAVQIQSLHMEQGGNVPDAPLELHEAAALPAAGVKDLRHEEAGGEVPAISDEIPFKGLFAAELAQMR